VYELTVHDVRLIRQGSRPGQVHAAFKRAPDWFPGRSRPPWEPYDGS
jgi:hypothetical protein